MLLTRLAFWYLPNPRFTRCLGGFGPNLDPIPSADFWSVLRHPEAPRLVVTDASPVLGRDSKTLRSCRGQSNIRTVRFPSGSNPLLRSARASSTAVRLSSLSRALSVIDNDYRQRRHD
jgi:hypothetical protein